MDPFPALTYDAPAISCDFWGQLTQRKLLSLEIIGTHHSNPSSMIVTEDKSASSSDVPVPCSDVVLEPGGKEMPCTATSTCQVDDHSDPKLVATWQYPIGHRFGLKLLEGWETMAGCYRY